MILGASSLSWEYVQNTAGPTVIKWGFVVGLGLYSLFAGIILKQVRVMSETIDGKYNKAIKAFAWTHLIMAVLLMVTASVLL